MENQIILVLLDTVLSSHSFPDQGHHGSTAIFVRTDIHFIYLQIRSPLQVVAIKIFIDHIYTVHSLYLPPNLSRERNEFDNLSNVSPSPLLLLGDFSGRYSMW